MIARVDQHRFGRAANAGAPHLAVQHQRPRFREIGLLVHIGVADAFEMREHRHARFGLHARDEALAAARHDQLDRAASPASMWPTAARSVVGTNWIAASGRPAASSPSTSAACMRARGMQRFRAAAQDRRVAGLDAERAGIRRHVRPALIDDAEHADRRRHARDVETVGPSSSAQARVRPDRASAATSATPFADRLDALGVELQPVHHRGAQVPRRAPTCMSSAFAARILS